MQIFGRRLVEHVARVDLPSRVFESRVCAKLVLGPDCVIECQRNAGLTAHAVEGSHGADLTRPGLVGRGVRVQVVQDVQQGESVLVLWEVEQASVSAFHLPNPVVGP